jgi:hypothetical protein
MSEKLDKLNEQKTLKALSLGEQGRSINSVPAYRKCKII